MTVQELLWFVLAHESDSTEWVWKFSLSFSLCKQRIPQYPKVDSQCLPTGQEVVFVELMHASMITLHVLKALAVTKELVHSQRRNPST